MGYSKYPFPNNFINQWRPCELWGSSRVSGSALSAGEGGSESDLSLHQGLVAWLGSCIGPGPTQSSAPPLQKNVQWYTNRKYHWKYCTDTIHKHHLNTVRIPLRLRSQRTIGHHSSTSEIPFNLIIIFWTLICIITNGRLIVPFTPLKIWIWNMQILNH